MRVIIVDDATADLREIGDYIAADNPRTAKRLIVELRAACLDLGQFPQKFPAIGNREGLTVRRRPHGNYAIFYMITERGVEVFRILHSARDADRILFPED